MKWRYCEFHMGKNLSPESFVKDNMGTIVDMRMKLNEKGPIENAN